MAHAPDQAKPPRPQAGVREVLRRLDQDYFAISFGLQAQVPLPYGSSFSNSVTYLPSVSDFQNDFLVKSEAALLLPL